MIRIKEVALLFGISAVTVYKWMRDGMPHVYVGKLLFFDKDKITEWVASHERD